MNSRAKGADARRMARFSEQNGRGGTHNDGNDDTDPAQLINKVHLLEKDLERRQESYVSRERAYKTRIDELEEELLAQRQSKTGWMKEDTKMNNLKNMQTSILKNVDLVQDRTARILQEQERDLVRAFRARLFDVQTELEKEKSKREDGAGAWIERCRQLEAEVEWAKEVADRLERVNQTLLQENNRLKSQFSSQEEDRNFLIKQLVSVKKDNARLRAEYVAVEKENETLHETIKEEGGKNKENNHQESTSAAPHNAAKGGESEDRYREVNIRMRRLLADERKSLQQVRQNYAQELKARTEMEMLLRQCVDDVRKEIARRHVESAQFSQGNDLAKMYNRQPGLIPVEDFTQEDRERALELLLSQERVVTLLYSKTFPINTRPKNSAGVVLGGELGSESSILNEGSASLLLDDGNGKSRPATTSLLGETKLPELGKPRPQTGDESK
jgi:hypothetical protein